ncbi:Apl5p [Sporobolomyces salmoneus]|uniref:Apl5p n=1 Tax=Sporobolomyces salmoneus TaxID=183962 RepID=UPI00317C8DD0
MFEQDVAGLIKALRANKNDEVRVVQQALDECRKEISNKDMDVKAAAVLKLVYLEMLGYSISFASFAIVECMTSPKFHIKFIGYLAASQCFDKETEVAVLVVNLVKKDLLTPPTPVFSSSPSSTTVAHLTSTLSSVSLLLTPPLARDLAPDILSLLSHSRPTVRKQTVLLLWRIVKSWPGVRELSSGREERGEDPWVERLRERLADEDMGVVGATVNVVCEAARKDPRRYLALAPELFGLLTGGTNNWMLIKIIKLFAVLTPEEPRLVKKLVPPLTDLIETTPAMSLLYECIQTSIVGGMLNGREGEILATTCVEKLGGFLEDVDQNLRYIALVALVKIAPTHPHLISTHHDTILNCVDDPDMSIRSRALDLVETMVNRQNLQGIVNRLMTHLRPSDSPSSSAADALKKAQQASENAALATSSTTPTLSASYRSSLILLIIRMSSSGTYANVSNFAWLIDILIELTYISLTIQPDLSNTPRTPSIGSKLRDQFIDVAARVRAIRPYAAQKAAALIQDEDLLDQGDGIEAAEVLGAAAWIGGEYCRDLPDPRPLIASLFGSSSTSSLPPHILSLWIHNGLKIYANWLSSLSHDWDESNLEQIRSITNALEGQLAECAQSTDFELLERAAELRGLLELVRKGLDSPGSIVDSNGGLDGQSDDEETGENGFASSRRGPPACLTMLDSLFFQYELNPVNPKAQGMVTLPEGLDLEVTINPLWGTEKDGLEFSEDEAVDDFGRPLRRTVPEEVTTKKKKGKGTSKKGSSKRRGVEENSEEVERQRSERLERQREDPYYIAGSSTSRRYDDEYEEEEEEDDVDSIPIVKLDLNLSTPRQPPTPPPREPTPPPMLVDVDGEMPTFLNTTPSPRIEPVEEKVDNAVEEKVEEKAAETQAAEGTVLKVVKKKKKKESGAPSSTTKPKKKKSSTSTPSTAALE